MYCPNCGTKLPDGAVFCPQCGARQPGARENDKNTENENKNKTSRTDVGQTAKFQWIMLGIGFSIFILLCIFTLRPSHSQQASDGYSQAVENMVHVENGDYQDLSDVIHHMVPGKIADETAELYEIASYSHTMRQLYDGEPNEFFYGKDVQFSKYTTVEELDASSLADYQEKIQYLGHHWNFLGTGGYNAGLVSYGLRLSEKDAEKFVKDSNQIQEFLSDAEVTDGYRVGFTYTVNGLEQSDSMDVVRTGGSWVVMDDQNGQFDKWTDLF